MIMMIFLFSYNRFSNFDVVVTLVKKVTDKILSNFICYFLILVFIC